MPYTDTFDCFPFGFGAADILALVCLATDADLIFIYLFIHRICLLSIVYLLLVFVDGEPSQIDAPFKHHQLCHNNQTRVTLLQLNNLIGLELNTTVYLCLQKSTFFVVSSSRFHSSQSSIFMHQEPRSTMSC